MPRDKDDSESDEWDDLIKGLQDSKPIPPRATGTAPATIASAAPVRPPLPPKPAARAVPAAAAERAPQGPRLPKAPPAPPVRVTKPAVTDPPTRAETAYRFVDPERKLSSVPLPVAPTPAVVADHAAPQPRTSNPDLTAPAPVATSSATPTPVPSRPEPPAVATVATTSAAPTLSPLRPELAAAVPTSAEPERAPSSLSTGTSLQEPARVPASSTEPEGPLSDEEWLARLQTPNPQHQLAVEGQASTEHRSTSNAIALAAPSSRGDIASNHALASEGSVARSRADSLNEGAPREPLCALWIGGTCFGLPVSIIGELSSIDSFTEIPMAPRHVVGIFNLRGVPIPVVDLVGALGFGTGARADQALVMGSGTLRFAIPVERVEMLAARRQVARRARTVTDHEAVTGFVELDDKRMVTVLSADTVLSTVSALRDAY